MADAEIFSVDASYQSVTVKLIPAPADGNPFYVRISSGGLEFFDRVSSSGNPEGNPVTRTASQALEWVGDDGTNKKFRERAAIKPKRGSRP
jgi:hypothetical protein